jgi:hypothetical protein
MHLPRSESPVYTGLSLSQQLFGDLYGCWRTSGRHRPRGTAWSHPDPIQRSLKTTAR